MTDPQPIAVHVVQTAAPKGALRAAPLRAESGRVRLRCRFNELGSKFVHIPSDHPGCDVLVERDAKDPTKAFLVTVYEEDVAAVQALVETRPEMVAQAKRAYDMKVREMVAGAT